MCRRRFAILWAFSLAWLQAGAAQAPADQDAQRSEPIEEAIDEITVIAPKTELSIRAEIVYADEKMYDLFNSINTNRDFHVVCDWENRSSATTASRLKEWQCVSLGEKHILSQEFSNLGGVDAIANARSFQALMQGPVRRHRKEMRAHMIELAEESPELANAIYERAALERDLAEAKRRKRE